jgi:hypothetical protein
LRSALNGKPAKVEALTRELAVLRSPSTSVKQYAQFVLEASGTNPIEHGEDSLRQIHALIVSENISMEMDWESSLPNYYARLVLRRGIEVRLACHGRVVASFPKDFPELGSRICLLQDLHGNKKLFRFRQVCPTRCRT